MMVGTRLTYVFHLMEARHGKFWRMHFQYIILAILIVLAMSLMRVVVSLAGVVLKQIQRGNLPR